MLKLKSRRTTEKMAAAAQTKVTPTCKEYRKFQGKKKKKLIALKGKIKHPELLE